VLLILQVLVVRERRVSRARLESVSRAVDTAGACCAGETRGLNGRVGRGWSLFLVLLILQVLVVRERRVV